MKNQEKLRIRISRISRGLLVASVAASVYGLYICIVSITEIVHTAPMGRLAVAPYVAELAEGLVLLVHYFLVAKFFIEELKEKEPFSHGCAHELRVIGWETILLPILVKIVTVIAFSWKNVSREMLSLELYELVLGFVLVLAGYVVDYATARIEAQKKDE